MENNYSSQKFPPFSSHPELSSEYFIISRNFQKKQYTDTSSDPFILNKQPSVSFIDYSLSKKQLGLNLYKKKQLRIDSAKRLTSLHKTRSLSSFASPTQYQLTIKIPLLQKSLNNNYQLTNQRSLSKEKSIGYHITKSNQIKLQFTKSCRGQKDIFDWGNKRKKKIRRLTGLVDYGKKDCQSTFDGKKDQKLQQTDKSKKIQFKNNLKRGKRQSNNFQNKRQTQDWTFAADNKQNDISGQQIFKQLKISDFLIGKKLGSGNFSEAFLVRHKKTGFLCALKVMRKQKIKQQGYQQQIIRQITIQSYLQHQNIVELYGFFQDQHKIYLLMQFCIQGHLYGMILQTRRIQQEKTAEIISGVAKGLEYLHNQLVIHRDLKPENIFINFEVAKIGDLGWAVYKGKNDQLRKTTSGSPLYYSPQVVQKEEYNQKIDIWGMGATTYECLIGMAPFKVYSLMNLDRIVTDEVKFPCYVEVSSEAVDFIQKCLKKRASQRCGIKQAMNHKFINGYIKDA